jgi:hypothetical protein
MKKGENAYTDEAILERAATHESLAALRKISFSFYQLIRRRGLLAEARHRFNVAAVERYLAIKIEKEKEEAVKVSKGEPIEPKKKRGRGPGKNNKPKPVKVPKSTGRKSDTSSSTNLYRAVFEGDVKICGRCFIHNTWTSRSNICRKCLKFYNNKQLRGQNHAPWNVKQEYCNSIIKHYEKEFHIGIRTDEKTQKYLSMVGYEFIFQEPYEDFWK